MHHACTIDSSDKYGRRCVHTSLLSLFVPGKAYHLLRYVVFLARTLTASSIHAGFQTVTPRRTVIQVPENVTYAWHYNAPMNSGAVRQKLPITPAILSRFFEFLVDFYYISRSSILGCLFSGLFLLLSQIKPSRTVRCSVRSSQASTLT